MDTAQPANLLNVEYRPAWLTWLAATSTCLNFLGNDHDITDLAGHSGYAYCLSIHDELCPSGPTILNWSQLISGAHALGRATQQFLSFSTFPVDRDDPKFREICDALFDFVRDEINRGRPVVLWGAYLPEFAAVVGTGEDCYHVESFRVHLGEEQPPIGKYDLNNVGICYALAFPGPSQVDERRAAVRTLFYAHRLLNQSRIHPGYNNGPTAYIAWAKALNAGRAIPVGAAYNAACWWEARHHASLFTQRLVETLHEAEEPLLEAADHLEQVAAALHEVKELFPFPVPGELDREACKRATEPLATARVEDENAIAAISEACELIKPGS